MYQPGNDERREAGGSGKGGVIAMTQDFSTSAAVSYRTNQVAAAELCRRPVDSSDVAGLRRRMKAEAVAIGVYGLYWHGFHVLNGIGVIPGLGYRTDVFDDSVIRDQANTQTAIEILRDDLTGRHENEGVPVDRERISRLVGESCDGPYLIRVHAPLYMADTVAELLGDLEVDPVLSDSAYYALLGDAVAEALDEWFIDEVAAEVGRVDHLPGVLAGWFEEPVDSRVTRWIAERAKRVSSYDELQPDAIAAEVLACFAPATEIASRLRGLAATGPDPVSGSVMEAVAGLITDLVSLDVASGLSQHTDTDALWRLWDRFNQAITTSSDADSEGATGRGC